MTLNPEIHRPQPGEHFRECLSIGALNDLVSAGWSYVAVYVLDGERRFLVFWSHD